MGDVTLFGVTGAALVTLLVQAAKVCKMPSAFAPIASLVAGFVVAGAYMAHLYYPAQADPWIQFVVMALLLGLAGSGLYAQSQSMQDVVQKRRAKRAIAEAPPDAQVVAVPSSSLPATGVAVDVPTGSTTRLSEDMAGDLP